MDPSKKDKDITKLAKAAGLETKKNNLTSVLMATYFSKAGSTADVQSGVHKFLDVNNLKVGGKKISRENVRVLSGNNNLNLIMKMDDNAVVITLGVKRPSADNAIDQLRKSNPSWLARNYGQVKYDGKTERVLDETGQINPEFNPFPTGQFGYVSYVEKCHTSLEARVKEIHRNTDNNDPKATSPLHMTQLVGLQVSKMLSDISKNDVIWMDFKPENLLLRAKDEIVVADTKAFRPVNELLVTHGGKRVYDDDIYTQAYVSDDYLINKKGMPCTREEFKKIWEKEYSHQLAMTLYHIATGHSLNTPMINPQPDGAKFDFSKPIFEGEQGQRLKTVIERLSEDKPENRIRHEDAAALLKVLGNPKKFEKEMIIADAALQTQAANAKFSAGSTLIAMSALMGWDDKETAGALKELKTQTAVVDSAKHAAGAGNTANVTRSQKLNSTKKENEKPRANPKIGSGRSKGS